MYQRLSPKESRKLSRAFMDDQLFVCLCKPLNKVSSEHNDLTAVEVWQKALDVVSRLKDSPRPDIEVSQIKSELDDDYRIFQKESIQFYREPEEAHRSSMLVMLTVLFMLSSTAKKNKDNPYKDICLAVSDLIKNDMLGKVLLAEVMKIEDAEEKKGKTIEEKDYLTEVVDSKNYCTQIDLVGTMKNFNGPEVVNVTIQNQFNGPVGVVYNKE